MLDRLPRFSVVGMLDDERPARYFRPGFQSWDRSTLSSATPGPIYFSVPVQDQRVGICMSAGRTRR
jgi:hypothetical protein